ncbi:hypothetical protein KOR42_44390 [Thalassoglobus neptunius]|uniref:DUF2271 domain-containing protein n=1 Tax=Thalassoglobus neptunius TaxID=1938619 RepID=A0A5C5W0G6_9PLAN|nr:DUF2271 domain-containing protein [Thalassoglobus neptunius]TWT43559.1 hypothetical protein KOR42_44390 [Thalassoglobus neptunius]
MSQAINSKRLAILGMSCFLSISALFRNLQQQSLAEEPETRSEIPMLISVELPRIRVREYHRPYVAVWIEDESRTLVKHVAVWFQQGVNDEGHGEKWLPDLRQWWRRGGRNMDDAVDAVSGATRGAGQHRIRVTEDKLKDLKPGQYNAVVEAAREVGGRELVRLPFQWPPQAKQQAQESGETELGSVSLQVSAPRAD